VNSKDSFVVVGTLQVGDVSAAGAGWVEEFGVVREETGDLLVLLVGCAGV